MITAYGSVGQAVEAIKAGAFDYIEKPFEQDAIRVIVDKAIGQAAANKLRRADAVRRRRSAERQLRPRRLSRRRCTRSSR